MKKAFLLLCVLFLSIFLGAQSFGFSASSLVFFPNIPETTDPSGSINRPIGHTSPLSPGVRVEANFMHIGTKPARFGYTGIGVSFFFPHADSAFYYAWLKSSGRVRVLGTSQTSCLQVSLRLGYDIPLDFNEFLTMHLGVGMGYMQYKTRYVLPEKSNTFNYEQSDFDQVSLIVPRSADVFVEALAGALYEFEKFYVLGQYSVIIGMDIYPARSVRHGLTAGIYYPLKRF